jgi:Flagellar biosynthesis protein, FliO
MSASATTRKPVFVGSNSATGQGEIWLHGLWSALGALCRWTRLQTSAIFTKRIPRRLSVVETISLAEKQFVSILCVDGEQFLLGGSSSNIVLLARLERGEIPNNKIASSTGSFGGLVCRLSCDEIRNAGSPSHHVDQVDQ